MKVRCQRIVSYLLSTFLCVGFGRANVTDVTLTGSVSNAEFSFAVFNDSVNWFQAFNYCMQAGYGELSDTLPGQNRLNAITEFLRTNNHPEPATFWVGQFRPYPQIVNWYHSGNCRSARGLDRSLSTTFNSGQCAAILYQTTSGYDFPTFVDRDCELDYPFICYKYIVKKPIVYYNGFSVTTDSQTFENETYSNVTYEHCEELFTNKSNCPLYTYMNSSGECLTWLLASGFGKGGINLTFTGENVTHGVKDGIYSIQYEILNENISSISVASQFPDCNVSAIPEGYCQCEIPDEEFDQLIQEMTIDSSSTSKAKLKLKSAEDHRTSSKFLGSVGITIITLVIGVICLSDVGTLLLKLSDSWKKVIHRQHMSISPHQE